ncbi:MAG: protein-disulfide reductase DsbD domain-containing protein [Qingshengfaniella sp.]
MTTFFFARRAALATLLAMLVPTLPALAGPARDPHDVISAEVLPGWLGDDGVRMAALRLVLQPGWKTYWRSPGAAGVPPVFDWSGSTNISGVRVHWPRPTPFTQYGLTTLGYANELILPLELFPRQAGTDAALKGRVALGVCQDICLPLTLDFAADLPATRSGDGTAAIRAALKARPTPGAAPALCALEPIEDGLRITATLQAPSQGTGETVVFEPGQRDLWVSETQVSRTSHTVTASAEIVPPEGRPFALSRQDMRITLIGGRGAVQFDGCTGD